MEADKLQLGVDSSITEGLRLSVMTLNLRVKSILDGKNVWSQRIDSVVSVFTAHRPVVVGTQEGLPEMLSDLSSRMPQYQFVGQGREAGLQGEHCALFYRTDAVEVEESGQFWLSETPDIPSRSWNTACPRICTWAQFRSKENTNVRFQVLNTHLDHKSRDARELGSVVIWKHIQRQKAAHKERFGRPLPIVLMGDMNADPTEDVIQFWRRLHAIQGIYSDLSDVYNGSECRVGKTYHGFRGETEGAPIDYIFVSQDVLVYDAQIDTGKYLHRYPSDHYPVLAMLGLRTASVTTDLV